MQQGIPQKLSSWQLRAALGEALSAVLRLDASLLTGELLDAAATFLQDLLADECYAARLAGARLVQARMHGEEGERKLLFHSRCLCCSAIRSLIGSICCFPSSLCVHALLLCCPAAGHAAAVRRPRARL